MNNNFHIILKKLWKLLQILFLTFSMQIFGFNPCQCNRAYGQTHILKLLVRDHALPRMREIKFKIKFHLVNGFNLNRCCSFHRSFSNFFLIFFAFSVINYRAIIFFDNTIRRRLWWRKREAIDKACDGFFISSSLSASRFSLPSWMQSLLVHLRGNLKRAHAFINFWCIVSWTLEIENWKSISKSCFF